MAHTLDVQTSDAIGLEDCLELLKALKQPDIAPGRGLSEAAIYLRKLANNREFLVDLVNAELGSLADLNRFLKKQRLLATDHRSRRHVGLLAARQHLAAERQ